MRSAFERACRSDPIGSFGGGARVFKTPVLKSSCERQLASLARAQVWPLFCGSSFVATGMMAVLAGSGRSVYLVVGPRFSKKRAVQNGRFEKHIPYYSLQPINGNYEGGSFSWGSSPGLLWNALELRFCGSWCVLPCSAFGGSGRSVLLEVGPGCSKRPF